MADKVMVTGPNGPNGELRATAGTADDWSKPTPIKQRLALALDPAYANPQTAPPVPAGMIRSFNQSMVLNHNDLEHVSARLTDAVSGRMMEMRTTETTIQLYTPAAGRDGILSDAGKPFTRVPAVALEPEHLPDSANRPEFPSIVLKPGQTFRSTSIWSFTTAR
jgi:aldose 1-epimerase